MPPKRLVVPTSNTPRTSKIIARRNDGDSNQITYFPSSFITWMHDGASNWTVLATIVIFTILVKWCIGLNSYSGKGVPPMHGDFEAQRHWIEITYHLPVTQWYRYDLKYWGLDYPPLTAYHSLLIGYIANAIKPKWISLDISRGYESEDLTAFMRSTALVTEYLVFVPALIFFVKSASWIRRRLNQDLLILLVLLHPPLMIIDHGHFQYNSAMLGFTLLALACFSHKSNPYYMAGSASFIASIFFKQMALYYALPIFSWLLGQCVAGGSREKGSLAKGVTLLVKLGMTVITTIILILLPFISNPKTDIQSEFLQVFHRVFPIERGLYEDKVASFWCAINVIIKLRSLFSTNTLLLLSTLFTLAGLAIPCYGTFRNPWSSKKLVYALTCSSLAFFLFSYHVHEKSILLVAMPAALLLEEEGVVGVWLQNVAMFSMWPLTQKDELRLAYIGILALFNFSCFEYWVKERNFMKFQLALLSHLSMLFLHFIEWLIVPPERYPHIHIVINVMFSATHFGGFLVWFTYRLVQLPSIDDDDRAKHKKE